MARLRDSSSRIETSPTSSLSTTPILQAARGRIPRMIVGHRAALSPLERFVLARVDGDLDIEQIAAGIALSIDEVLAVFLALSGRGVVRLDPPRVSERRTTSSMRTRATRADAADEVVDLSDGDLEELEPETPAPTSRRAPDASGPFPRPSQSAAPPSSKPQPRPALPSIPPSVPRPTKR